MFQGGKKFLWFGGAGSIAMFGALLYLPSLMSSTYHFSDVRDTVATVLPATKPEVAHIDTPEPLKALYMTACVAGTPSWRESLKQLIEETELNAVVLDIKDYTGIISFPNTFPQLNTGKGCVVADMKDFIEELHASEIYVIGRISVFQDMSYTQLFPELAVRSVSTGGVWKDRKGLSFVDVGAQEYWDYIVDLSNEAYALGFDELNYDYIRYPSDGNMQDADYTYMQASSTRSMMLENFFAYLHSKMKDTGAVISADLFGMTTTVESDMGIGQILEKALPYFDYIAPMVYPSHYPPTWNGLANPAEHPYEVIKISMSRAVERERVWNIANGQYSFDSNGATTTPASKMRPWIQDFNLGATYGPDKVRAQIQATYDVGLTSWMLWNAGNKYTREALLVEDSL